MHDVMYQARMSAAVACVAMLLGGCEQPLDADGGTTQAAAASANSGSGSTEIARGACQQPTENTVYFNIGSNVLRVPEASIVDTVPVGISDNTSPEDLAEAVRVRIAAGEGCPEKPMETALLLVKEDLGHPLLEGSLGLLRAPSGSITGPFAELTKSLQQRPNQNCRQLEGELIACVGTETRGDRETQVMYVISTDTSFVMNSGGPLAARCVLQQNEILGCNLVDELGGDVAFDITFAAGEYTTAGLKGARAAALSRLAAYRP